MIYNNDISIPSTCPLEFKSVENVNELTHYPRAFNYVQKWGTADTIHVKLLASEDRTAEAVIITAYDTATDIIVHKSGGGAATYSFTWTQLSASYWYADVLIPCSDLSGVIYFYVTSTVGDLFYSWPCEIGAVSDSVLITYHHSENDFSTVFGTYETAHVFTLRVEGGFIPNDFELECDQELFTNQQGEDTQTYSMPYDIEYLTLGDGGGLPRWMCQKLNRIFACDTLVIAGRRYSKTGKIERSDAVDLKSTLRIGLKETQNRMVQSIGDLILVNEEYIEITDDLDNELEI
jgi:hypothetical protein